MKKLKNIFVTKSSGKTAHFDRKKLENSLVKSKAKKEQILNILNQIEAVLYDGISTKEIYKLAYKLLYNQERHTAGIYNLKNAIAEMGPTGYPFEIFIGKLLSSQGYDVKIGEIISGACVEHEVDIVAEKNGHLLLSECKFHSDPNRHSDVKVPLYIYARFADIVEAWDNDIAFTKEFTEGRIYTNTRFTKDAIRYASCKGLDLVAWDFPKKGSLKEQIDLTGLYPITCLPNLSKEEKQKLLNLELVLVKDLIGKTETLQSIGITNEARISKLMKAATRMSQI